MAVTISTPTLSAMLDEITSGTPYLALYTSNPGAGDTGTEVTGGSYARQAITFGAVDAGAVRNTNAVSFTGMPLTTVTHWAIRSAATGGTLRVSAPFSPTIPFQAGDVLDVAVDQLAIGLEGI